MIKKFFLNFGVLFILLFQFTSCLDNNANNKAVYFFYDEPVVVDQMGKYPFIRNESYSFYVPELADNSILRESDLLWSSFVVDLDDKDYPSIFSTLRYTARHFRYEVIDSTRVIIPADAAEFQSKLSDDYSDPIGLSFIYRYAIDNLLFFGFKHKNHSNRSDFTYELILNPEIEFGSNNYPTLYIRSMKIDGSETSKGKAYSKDGNIFAFDVTDFVTYYRKNVSSTGRVHFNLKYKTGVDEKGKDIYRSFMSNPITRNFNTGKPQ